MADNETAREQQIVKKALKLFSQTGYQSTSLQDIADELGITRPAFYYYFKSKDDLLWRLIGNLGDQLLAEALPIVNRDGTSEDKLRKLLIAHTRQILRNVDAFRIYFAERHLVGRSRDQRLRKGESRYVRLFEMLIKSGQVSGAMRDGDERVLALMVIGLTNSVLRWYRPAGNLSVDDLSEIVADLGVNSLRRSQLGPNGSTGKSRDNEVKAGRSLRSKAARRVDRRSE